MTQSAQTKKKVESKTKLSKIFGNWYFPRAFFCN